MRSDTLILLAAVGLGLWLGKRWLDEGQARAAYTSGPLLGYGSFFRGETVARFPTPAATWGLGVPNIGG